MDILNDMVIACVQATNGFMNDRDQRSAIGMADAFLRTGKEVERSEYFSELMKNRDDLAIELVEIVREYDEADGKEALALVRQAINEPFLNPEMSGQAAKAALEKGSAR